MTSSRGRRAGHPCRQPDLLLRHATRRKHRGSDPVRPCLTPGPLGDTRKVMPASHHWEMLESYRPGTVGTRVDPSAQLCWACALPGGGEERLTSRRSAVSCCGAPAPVRPCPGLKARRGPGRPVDNGEPRPLPAGRTPVRRYDRALSCGRPPARVTGRPDVPSPAASQVLPSLRPGKTGYPAISSRGKGRPGRPGSREGRDM